ncbi:acetyl-CoA hydrolase/transferase C-terminal domain-containing protein [Methanospirillum stamsii]|uniref:acetyl-CoA hydrolase/transferase C-terminal domain-containing protein n=1 Tax=Methanospirillum stamsii TaxID=1277351 RepID=UPI002684C4B1
MHLQTEYCPKTFKTSISTRYEVHYLVTEFGSVNLKGKDTRERALAIIKLAHPAYRDNLLHEADVVGLI